MNEEESKAPFAGVVYGAIVYWITVVSSIVVIVGSVLAFITQADFASPSYWISALWQGKQTAEIWGELAVAPPVGHWYLNHLGAGDGLTSFGISLGVSSITLGMIASAVILFKESRRFLGLLALIAAVITVISMLGLTPVPS